MSPMKTDYYSLKILLSILKPYSIDIFHILSLTWLSFLEVNVREKEAGGYF